MQTLCNTEKQFFEILEMQNVKVPSCIFIQIWQITEILTDYTDLHTNTGIIKL